jgi:hypothetical protein
MDDAVGLEPAPAGIDPAPAPRRHARGRRLDPADAVLAVTLAAVGLDSAFDR